MRTTKYSISSPFGRAQDVASGNTKLEPLVPAQSSFATLRAQQRGVTSARTTRAAATLAPRRVGHRGR